MNKVTIISQRTGVSTFASPISPSTGQSLQKSFHLSHADKIETLYGSRTPLKGNYEVCSKKISSPSENKKYATAQAPNRKKSVAMETPKLLTGKRFNDSMDR